eukprot:173348-Amorphochlora_amoeboformis.AAC.2
MKRRKVLPVKAPPWANLVNETKKKVEDPSASSVASSSVENSGKKTQASAVRTSAQNTAIQSAPPTSYSSSSVPAPKRKRKRKSRFDERPPDSDIRYIVQELASLFTSAPSSSFSFAWLTRRSLALLCLSLKRIRWGASAIPSSVRSYN